MAGLVRVNKVIGNIQITPGRTFQAARSQIYDFVPYLKNDGNRHDFSHTIQYLYFTADDEADESKAQVSKEMRERLGIYHNPLDEHEARVCDLFFAFIPNVFGRFERVRYRRQRHNTCSTTSSRSCQHNSAH